MGVIAVTAREPLPAVIYGGELGMVPTEFEQDRLRSELVKLGERVKAIAHEDPRWESRVLLGDPARMLADLARETNAPLISCASRKATPSRTSHSATSVARA